MTIHKKGAKKGPFDYLSSLMIGIGGLCRCPFDSFAMTLCETQSTKRAKKIKCFIRISYELDTFVIS
jgi:hypothetical protein